MRDAAAWGSRGVSYRPQLRSARVLLAGVGLLGLAGFTSVGATTAPSLDPPPAPPAGIGIRLVDLAAPTDDTGAAGEDPRARVYVIDHLAPGDGVTRQVEVKNPTDAVVNVSLYAAAATIHAGTFRGSAGRTSNAVSTWTAVTPPTAAVPAHGSLTAAVVINVPGDADVGEQYAAVWAESRSDGESGVTQVNRVGIRLYLSVGPGAEPLSDFAIDSLVASCAPDGQPMVLVNVRNTGQRALDLAGALEVLGGPDGRRAGPFGVTPGTTIAIGQTEQVEIAVGEDLPAGPWDAEITLRSGTLERAATAAVTFPASGASPPVDTTAIRASWRTPAIVGLVLVIMVVGAAVVFDRWRRSRPARSIESPRTLAKLPPDDGEPVRVDASRGEQVGLGIFRAST